MRNLRNYAAAVAVLVVPAALALVGCAGTSGDDQTSSALQRSVTLGVMADPHYYDTSLGTTGTAFETYLAQDRKLLRESGAILDAAVDHLSGGDAEIVIVPGDLTKDGEKVSHEGFAAAAAALEAAGKKVYVICGNHDINNPHAFSYSGASTTKVDHVSPAEFKSIYAAYGYNEAIAQDPGSLSYVVEPVTGLWLIAMDSCDYENNITDGKPHTGGGFSAATLAWITGKIREGRSRDKIVIGFAHHGIVEHFSQQEEVFGEYVVEDWEDVADALADAGMHMVLTGHFHAQDIVKHESAAGNVLYDVLTGSLVTYPCPLRELVLDPDAGLAVATETIDTVSYDTSPQAFPEYALSFLETGISTIVPYMLAEIGGMSQAQAEAVADMEPAPTQAPGVTIRSLLTDAMIAIYQGDETIDPLTDAVVQGMGTSSDPTTQMLYGLLTSAWSDLAPADNNVSITLR